MQEGFIDSTIKNTGITKLRNKTEACCTHLTCLQNNTQSPVEWFTFFVSMCWVALLCSVTLLTVCPVTVLYVCTVSVGIGTAASRQTQIRLPPFSTWDMHTESRFRISVLYHSPICNRCAEHLRSGLISEGNGLFPHCRRLLVIRWTDCSFAIAWGHHMLLFLSPFHFSCVTCTNTCRGSRRLGLVISCCFDVFPNIIGMYLSIVLFRNSLPQNSVYAHPNNIGPIEFILYRTVVPINYSCHWTTVAKIVWKIVV